MLSPLAIILTAIAFFGGIGAGWFIRGERRQQRENLRHQRQAERCEALEQQLAASERKLRGLQGRQQEVLALTHRQKKQLASTRAALDEQIYRNRASSKKIEKANELLSQGRSERRTLQRQLQMLIRRTQAERSENNAPVIKDKPLTLRSVRGIGPAIARQLAALGITHLSQIAELDDAAIDTLDAQLKFPGRIRRDEWVAQARQLLGLGDAETIADTSAGDEGEHSKCA